MNATRQGLVEIFTLAFPDACVREQDFTIACLHGRTHVEWTYEETIDISFDTLAQIGHALCTNAINIQADPGSDGSWTYGGGGSKGQTRIKVWPGKWPGTSDDLELARNDRITRPW